MTILFGSFKRDLRFDNGVQQYLKRMREVDKALIVGSE